MVEIEKQYTASPQTDPFTMASKSTDRRFRILFECVFRIALAIFIHEVSFLVMPF